MCTFCYLSVLLLDPVRSNQAHVNTAYFSKVLSFYDVYQPNIVLQYIMDGAPYDVVMAG